MSEYFNIEIVNPEKSFLSQDDVIEVVLPAFEGEMGILKDHISIISFLKPGIIKIFSKQKFRTLKTKVFSESSFLLNVLARRSPLLKFKMKLVQIN